MSWILGSLGCVLGLILGGGLTLLGGKAAALAMAVILLGMTGLRGGDVLRRPAPRLSDPDVLI